MSFNTKTPTMDFSPFLRRDFSKDNRGGAIAQAMNGFADDADGYGANADKALLGALANETDASKVDGTKFYSPLNALNATKIINDNKDRVYKDGEIARAGELNARTDAQYAIDVFNKEASNDALSMDKATFDAKYSNAGGIDGGMMQKIFNDKQDRTFGIEDRNIKNNLTNLQIQNTKNNIAQQGVDNKYTQDQRVQTAADNEFMKEYSNGTLTPEKIAQYKDRVSAKTFDAVTMDNKASSILNKYPDFKSFQASEDYKNPEYNYSVKKMVYDSFGKGEKTTSLTDQITGIKIDNNLKSLPDIKEQYKKEYGEDMPTHLQSSFVYENKLPEKLKPVEKKALPTKDAGEYQALSKYEQVLNELEKAYDSSYVGGVDSSLNTVSPNFVLSDGHRKFNNLMNDVLLGKTSALTGTLSDRDMALLQSSGLSETLGEKDFLDKLKQTKEQVQQMKNNSYKVLDSQYDIPKDFAKSSVITNANNKNDVKVNSVRKTNDTNITKEKTIMSTGKLPDGTRVIKYSDGSIENAN